MRSGKVKNFSLRMFNNETETDKKIRKNVITTKKTEHLKKKKNCSGQ